MTCGLDKGRKAEEVDAVFAWGPLRALLSTSRMLALRAILEATC